MKEIQNVLFCYWGKKKHAKLLLNSPSSLKPLKVLYYTVFYQFHTAVRGPTTLYLKCIAPNPSVVLNFSCLKVALQSSIQSSLFLCLHL